MRGGEGERILDVLRGSIQPYPQPALSPDGWHIEYRITSALTVNFRLTAAITKSRECLPRFQDFA
jgi:hypothetical protein